MLHLTHLPHHEPGEKVILHLRRHWFVLAQLIAVYVVLGLVPMVIRWFLGNKFPGIFQNELWKVLLALLLSVYYLYWWLLLYRGFLDYYLDLWIVTDRRIINIEQNDLFNRVISEQRLSRIQDVTSKQQGMLSTLLDYGTVTIQTAGQVQYFSFEEIARPHTVAQKINTLVEWNRHKHGIGQNS